MSSFDAERGVMVLEPEQWDVLQRMVTGPVAQRADYAEGVLVGLEEIGVIDPYGPTLMVSTSTAVMIVEVPHIALANDNLLSPSHG